MKSETYFRWSLIPPLALMATMGKEAVIPYVILLVFGFVWTRNKTAEQTRKFVFRTPVYFAVIFDAIWVPYIWFTSVNATGSALSWGLAMAGYCIVIGYLLVGIIFSFHWVFKKVGLVKEAPEELQTQQVPGSGKSKIIKGAMVFVIVCAIAWLIFAPKVRQFAYNPYIEMVERHVKDQIVEVSKRDGRFPSDIAPLIDLAIQERQITGKQKDMVKGRAYQYDPVTGNFEMEMY